MIFPVAECIAYVSRFITLHPGDLLITGTPPGVGDGQKPNPIFLKPGDEIRLQKPVPYHLATPQQAGASTRRTAGL